ncbi:hypothetical protein UlMin_023776 [Ulmus minor]
MGGHHYPLFLLILLLVPSKSHSWSLFPSSSSSKEAEIGGSIHAEFSMEVFNDQNGKNNFVSLSSCWQDAFRHRFSGCSEILATDEKRSRLAWHLSDCFQKDSGRSPFPSCDSKSSMVKCLKALDDHEHKVYLEFYLETNSICHRLQAHAFKQEVERLVNELKGSADYAEEKLETIEERTESLLQGSNKIYDSLSSIDQRTKIVAQTAKNLEDHVDVVLKQTTQVYDQSRKISSSQEELQQGQVEMKKNLKQGMEILQDSYNNLGQEIDKLRTEAVEIEKEISKIGDAMSEKMRNLQSKADDIGNMAGVSLDKQQQLLDGQDNALKGLQYLTRFQSEALEESRSTLQRLAEYGHRQQEELLQRQKQLQQVHDHLMDNSKSILAAQESFESKQASMFVALDKLFALHNAMMLESRLLKAFFVYCILIFIIYMFTSTKQTYTQRPLLYIGLCATFCIEVGILRFFTTFQIEQQTWIINLVRLFFVILASVQLIHAIYTYRDYEVLNYQLLQTLMEKVNGIKRQELSWESSESDVDWSSWIDFELPEDVNNLEDPDYIFPEEVGENSITTTSTTRKYNLRRRLCH